MNQRGTDGKSGSKGEIHTGQREESEISNICMCVS